MNQLLLDNPYVADILYQPEALRASVDGFAALEAGEIRCLAKRLADGALKRVVLTGMGSSFHALHPLYLRLIEQGIATTMLETSELIHSAPALISPETLLVAVSQSGRSAETVQLLDRAQDRVACIGVTNTPGSPLADRANAALLTRAGDEFSVSCKTYLSGLAGLMVLGDLLTGQDPTTTLQVCGNAADAVEAYLAGWGDWVDAAMDALSSTRDVILTGRGASLSAVGTGGLIIKEAALFHSEGMSSAAFRHGPFEMLSSDLFVMVYAGCGVNRQLNENLVSDIHKAGGRAVLVARGEGSGLFGLPSVADDALPFVEILPAQILSLALAVLKQHIPGVFVRGNKVTEVI